MSRILILTGIILLSIGIIFYLAEESKFKWLSWFGNLPGDIKIEKENFKLYIPLVSFLIISLIFNIIIKILKIFFDH